jgi:opacity protein-like surface antigen
MKKIVLAWMAALGLVCATTAFADDEVSGNQGWYVYGAAGQTSGNGDQSTLDNALTSVGGIGFSSSLSTPTVYNLDIGYQVNQNLAVEGGYIGSTDETYNAIGGNLVHPVSASARIAGWTLVAVGILPLDDQFSVMGLSVPDRFSLLGKIGVSGIKDSATVTGPNGTVSADSTKNDITYGIGVKYDFTDTTSMRLCLDSYSVGSSTASSRSTVWTVGVGYHF